MDIDSTSAPMVTQHEHEEEKESAASTAVDIRGRDDDDEKASSAALTEGMTPTQQLLYAAEKGDCEQIRAAIGRGADVKVHDLGPKVQADERRRLEEAAGGKARTKKQLEAEEKEQESVFRDMVVTEDTAMHKAAERGHVAAVDLLFFAEADIEGKNRLGSTPLHRAVSSKQAEVVSLLLRHGARIDAVNAIGNTALHIASYQGDLEMASLLITHAKHEAYRLVVAVNQAGLTPIDYARKKQMHTLLTSYRLLASATSSFIRGPLGDHTADGTPKNGRMLAMHLSAEGAPQLSRPGSWGKALNSELAVPRDDHGLHSTHPHHAPNPPIGGYHNTSTHSSNGSEHGALLQHSRPHTQTDDQYSTANNKPASPTTAATSLSAAAQASQAQPVLPTSSFSTLTGPFESDSPASHTRQPAAASAAASLAAAAAGEQPLHSRPSFEKTSSLDSHPLEERESSVSVVGQMVSPVLASRGAETMAGGSVSMTVDARGVSMGGLSLNMLPNECETRDEDKTQ